MGAATAGGVATTRDEAAIKQEGAEGPGTALVDLASPSRAS